MRGPRCGGVPVVICHGTCSTSLGCLETEIPPQNPHHYQHWVSLHHEYSRFKSRCVQMENDNVNAEQGFRDAIFAEGLNPQILKVTPCIRKGWNNFTASWMAGFGSSPIKTTGDQWARLRMGDLITSKQTGKVPSSYGAWILSHFLFTVRIFVINSPSWLWFSHARVIKLNVFY